MIGKIKLLRAANVSPHTGASRFVAAGLFFIIQSCVTSSVCYHLLPSGSDNSPSGVWSWIKASGEHCKYGFRQIVRQMCNTTTPPNKQISFTTI